MEKGNCFLRSVLDAFGRSTKERWLWRWINRCIGGLGERNKTKTMERWMVMHLDDLEWTESTEEDRQSWTQHGMIKLGKIVETAWLKREKGKKTELEQWLRELYELYKLFVQDLA